MSGLNPQTLVNENRSYYLRAGAGGEGVPSPFSVVDETPPTLGSRLTITNADNVSTIANVNDAGSTRAQVVLGDAATLTSASAPLDGYNLRCTSSNTRVTQPLVVQTGSPSGIVMSNTLTGTGIIANNAGGQPSGSGIALNSTGTITLNNGNLIAGSNIVSLGVQNSSYPSIVANGGSNLQWWSNSTSVDANIGRASSGVLNINAQSNLVMSVSGTTRIYASTAGMDLLGNIGIPATTGNLSLNGNNLNMGSGQILYPSAMAMNNGSTIGGVGTLNMVDGLGFGSGTINGLSNINCAGVQPVRITGNGATPTPLITFANTGAITNTNPQSDTILNGTTMTYGSTGNNPSGGIRHFYQANVNANGSSFVTLTGAGLWLFSAQSQTNPAGWSFTMRLFNVSNAVDLLSVGSPPNWTINNNGNPYAFDIILSGASDPYTVTATRLGAW